MVATLDNVYVNPHGKVDSELRVISPGLLDLPPEILDIIFRHIYNRRDILAIYSTSRKLRAAITDGIFSLRIEDTGKCRFYPLSCTIRNMPNNIRGLLGKFGIAFEETEKTRSKIAIENAGHLRFTALKLSIQDLDVINAARLREAVIMIGIKHVVFHGCKIHNLHVISCFRNVKILELYECNISDISYISNFTGVTSLTIDSGTFIHGDTIPDIPSVDFLRIEGSYIRSLGTNRLQKTCKINISNCHMLEDISAAEGTSSVVLLCCNGITNIKPLHNVPNVHIKSCVSITDFSALGELESRVSLSIIDCPGLTDVSMLGNVEKSLDISNCINIVDITALQWVESLNLCRCTGIRDVSMLYCKAIDLRYISRNVHGVSVLQRRKINLELDEHRTWGMMIQPQGNTNIPDQAECSRLMTQLYGP